MKREGRKPIDETYVPMEPFLPSLRSLSIQRFGSRRYRHTLKYVGSEAGTERLDEDDRGWKEERREEVVVYESRAVMNAPFNLSLLSCVYFGERDSLEELSRDPFATSVSHPGQSASTPPLLPATILGHTRHL